MKTVDFYYDFASPTTYLGYHRLRTLADKYQATVVYKPILLGALHKATGNTPPGTVPAKGRYMMADLMRFAKRYDVEIVFNPFFPINCIKQLRGSIAMEGSAQEEIYREAIFNAVWRDQKNIADVAVFESVLSEAGIEAAPLLQAIEREDVKQKLKDNTAEAVERGAFGAPTFYIGNDMYFGQDRLDFIEERLAAD